MVCKMTSHGLDLNQASFGVDISFKARHQCHAVRHTRIELLWIQGKDASCRPLRGLVQVFQDLDVQGPPEAMKVSDLEVG